MNRTFSVKIKQIANKHNKLFKLKSNQESQLYDKTLNTP